MKTLLSLRLWMNLVRAMNGLNLWIQKVTGIAGDVGTLEPIWK